MSSLTPEEFSLRFRHDMLQAGMVEALLFGVFTVIALLTLRRNQLTNATPHKTRQQRSFIALVLAMYVCSIAHLVGLWTLIVEAFIDHGESAQSVVAGLRAPSVARRAVMNISRGAIMFIGDGIMIWRCWHLYSESWRVIAVPLLFLAGELGLFFTRVVYAALSPDLGRILQSKTLAEDLIIAHHFLVLAATVLTTFLIVLRIIRMGGFKKYRDVVTILLESSALYACAIIICMPFHSHRRFLDILPSTVLAVIPGISSTLIIAKVSRGRTVNRTVDEEIEMPWNHGRGATRSSIVVILASSDGDRGTEGDGRASDTGVFPLQK